MYFSALRRTIQSLEEKIFYDIALMFLEVLGYKDLSIVDGPGDGGRDVVSSRTDLRIQLSVRRDWERKINEEAETTRLSGRRHLVFITNRQISPARENEFLTSEYLEAGKVEVTIHDLADVSTTLSRPGVIKRSYERLGMVIPQQLHATPEEIAISSVLLFSKEARELREEMIEALVRAEFLRGGNHTEVDVINAVSVAFPYAGIERAAASAVSRLRVSRRVVTSSGGLALSDAERSTMEAAELEYLAAIAKDVATLGALTRLSPEQSRQLLDLATNLVSQSRDLSGKGPAEEQLRAFLAGHGLTRRRTQIYEALSTSAVAGLRRYGSTVRQIFETDTFDIYRALGQRTDLTMVLDASVAMPLIFSLAFRPATSRYGVSALALKRAADAHGMRVVVPRCYLNEMAAHGMKALEFLEIYKQLPEDATEALTSSQNAYLSHFSHISWELRTEGKALTLDAFLRYFGIYAGRSIGHIENKIQSVLDQFGVRILPDRRYDPEIKREIVEKKPNEDRLIVDHDAIVCTILKEDDEKGFIFVTWDRVLTIIVEDLTRVYADTPARAIDFLAMTVGSNVESDINYETFSALLHADEQKAERLARAVERIRTADQVYKLDAYVSAARRQDSKWQLRAAEVENILDLPELVEQQPEPSRLAADPG